MQWLILASAMSAMLDGAAHGVSPSDDLKAELEARSGDGSANGERLLTMANGVATIEVRGVLTQSPDFMAMIFGGGNTTYPEFIGALQTAEADSGVNSIKINMHSPGGMVAGMFDAIEAMQAATKPIKVIASQATSAAFAIAAQADELVAASRAAEFGSIGIVTTRSVSASRIDITSTNAPNKRPDPTTVEGKAAIVEELDAVHDLFVEAIADGRETSAEKINAEFGRGGTLLADSALKRGMIDAVVGGKLKASAGDRDKTKAAVSGNKPESLTMTYEEFKAQHPGLFAQAVAEGEAKGVSVERERVSAHIVLGQASGAMAYAVTAIKDGKEMSALASAEYQAAAMNKGDLANRDADNNEAGGADSAESQGIDADADADKVATMIENALGLDGVK